MSEKALKEFIETSRGKGISDREIEDTLLEKGWDYQLVKRLMKEDKESEGATPSEGSEVFGREVKKEENRALGYLNLLKNGIAVRTPDILDIKEGLIFFSVVMIFLFLWAGIMFDLIRNIIILILIIILIDFLFYAVKSSEISYDKIVLGDKKVEFISEKRGVNRIDYKDIKSIRPEGSGGWMAIPALVSFNNYFSLQYEKDGNPKKIFITFDLDEALFLVQEIAEKARLEKKENLIWG